MIFQEGHQDLENQTSVVEISLGLSQLHLGVKGNIVRKNSFLKSSNPFFQLFRMLSKSCSDFGRDLAAVLLKLHFTLQEDYFKMKFVFVERFRKRFRTSRNILWTQSDFLSARLSKQHFKCPTTIFLKKFIE